jgi:hypothetical protein
MKEIFDIIIIIVGLGSWGNIIASQITPIEYVKNMMGIGQNRKLYSTLRVMDNIIYFIHKLINCSLCIGFHLTWLHYYIYKIPTPILIGGIVYIVSKKIKEILDNTYI